MKEVSAVLPQRLPQYNNVASSNRDGVERTTSAPIEAMDPQQVAALGGWAALAESVKQNQSGLQAIGQGGVALRTPGMPLDVARQGLAGLVATVMALQVTLAKNAGNTSVDDGSAIRAAESVASQAPLSQVRSADAGATPGQVSIGVDSPSGTPSPNQSFFMVSLVFSFLINLLRELLLEGEAIDNRASAKMTIMSSALVDEQNKQLINQARTETLAAATGAVVAGGVGLAAVNRSFKSTSMQTNSSKTNLAKAHETDVRAAEARTEMKVNVRSTPSDLQRPSRMVDGTPPAATGASAGGATAGTARPSADLQADADVDLRPKLAVGATQVDSADAAILKRAHEVEIAKSQIPASHATFLMAITNSLSEIGRTGWGVQAKTEQGLSNTAQKNAEITQTTASNQAATADKTRELRQATAQLWETMMSAIFSTTDLITRKMG